MKSVFTWMSWSSGKDSAFALHCLSLRPECKITGLLTTVTSTYERVSMHGVRRALLQRQASEMGLRLIEVEIPPNCSNANYEERFGRALKTALSEGVQRIAFGDLYLTDIRKYREELLGKLGLEAEFPLWLRPTDPLALEMIRSGIRAVITCVDPKKLPGSFAGRRYDLAFLKDLPAGVDPCGENGEFHTFVYDSPLYQKEIGIEVGDIVERDGFVFADVMTSNP